MKDLANFERKLIIQDWKEAFQSIAKENLKLKEFLTDEVIFQTNLSGANKKVQMRGLRFYKLWKEASNNSATRFDNFIRREIEKAKNRVYVKNSKNKKKEQICQVPQEDDTSDEDLPEQNAPQEETFEIEVFSSPKPENEMTDAESDDVQSDSPFEE
ncbi:uncharacterized protein LOC129810465 [Phlebotomus papatasi]|nr:uncharacterized protein LOC129810465 [Phlebotomus papatasi]